jgi:hypothetical protein
MLRNRISAKVSRDRKKKEFEQLVTISKNLMNENYMLNQELEKKENDIQFYKNTSKSFCDNCKNILLNNNLQEPSKTIYSMNDITEEGKSNFTNYLKYSVYASFLVVMCIIGTFSTFSILSPEVIASVTGTGANGVSISTGESGSNGGHNARMLLSLPNNTEKIQSISMNKTSTDLVLMEKLIQIYKPKEYFNHNDVSKPIYENKKANDFLGYNIIIYF